MNRLNPALTNTELIITLILIAVGYFIAGMAVGWLWL